LKRYFITGTNTDCGKTYVTAQLMEYYPQAIAIKPVASGCDERGGQLVSHDAQYLKQFCSLSLNEITPWRFKLPISPHLAARAEGVTLKIAELADYCLKFSAKNKNTLFIEGAGGLMVPLNETETWIDFLSLTKIPVILVVGMTLGCINHALLTQVALAHYKIPCAGWIANCLDNQMLALHENITTLTEVLSFPLLSVIPYKGAISTFKSLNVGLFDHV